MSDTAGNLKDAFAGESQANQKYRAFAKRAKRDGFPNIAKLFRTTAEAERIHAEGHLKALDEIGSTVENLKVAIAGETYEYKEMYPPMLAQAEEEGHKAKRMFGYAVDAEEVHARLYRGCGTGPGSGRDGFLPMSSLWEHRTWKARRKLPHLWGQGIEVCVSVISSGLTALWKVAADRAKSWPVGCISLFLSADC